MPTVFESLSDGFYTAFFEPNPEKSRTEVEVWIREVVMDSQNRPLVDN